MTERESQDLFWGLAGSIQKNCTTEGAVFQSPGMGENVAQVGCLFLLILEYERRAEQYVLALWARGWYNENRKTP